MLSDALILLMWPKWVQKDLQEVAKNVISWEKSRFLGFISKRYFTLISKMINYVAGTEIFEIKR